MKNILFYLLFVFPGAFINGQNVSNIQINTPQTHIAFLANRDTLKIKMLSSSEKPLVIATGLASTQTNSGLEDERFLLWDNEGTRFIYQKNQRIHVYYIENQTTKSFILPEKLRLFKYFRINQIDIFQDTLYFSAGYASEDTNFNLFSFNLKNGTLEKIFNSPEQIANVAVSNKGETLAFSYYNSTYEYISSGLKVIDLKTKAIITEQDFKTKSFISNISFLNSTELLFRNVYGDNFILNFSDTQRPVLEEYAIKDFGYFLKSSGKDHLLQLKFVNGEKRYAIFSPKDSISNLLIQKKNIQLLNAFSDEHTFTYYYSYQDGKTPPRLLKSIQTKEAINLTDDVIVDFGTENRLEHVIYEVFNYKNSTGKTSNAYLYLPKQQDPTKNIPLIVLPYGRYSDSYPDFKYFLNKISFRLLEKGFGLAFINTSAYADYKLKDDYGKRQLIDTELFIKAISESHPINKEKIYAIGHSHGATMVYYYLTHSNMFAGGIAINGAADWSSQAKLKSMTGLPGEMGVSPEELPQKYNQYSPLENLSQETAPILIVSGGLDKQIPFEINAKAMYEKSKKLNLDFRWLHFKDEGHLINQSTHIQLITDNILKIFN